MPVTPIVSGGDLSALRDLVASNATVDWREIALNDPKALDGLAWGTAATRRDELVPLLKAYQRLVRLLPAGEEGRAFPLLGDGLHSAIQIAGLSRDAFARRWSALFPGEDAAGAALHQSAISRRAALVLSHLDAVQHHEPHYRAARFR